MGSIDLLKGKKLFRVTIGLREKVLGILEEELSKEERVLLAIVFGASWSLVIHVMLI